MPTKEYRGLELQRLRLRLLSLLYAMLIQKQCMEITERFGARQVINLIQGRSVDFTDLFIGGCAFVAGIKIPKIIAQYSVRSFTKVGR